jgi:hypothetical protein
VELFDRRQSFDAWVRRVETPHEDAERVRELLADWIEDGEVSIPTIVLKARRSQA